MSEELSGSVYEKYVESALEYEKDRKASLEQRGVAVVTSSAVLVTLIFGFATFAAGKGNIDPGPAPRTLLAVGLAGFLVAILFGLSVSHPLSKHYEPVAVASLKQAVDAANWDRFSATEAARRVSEIRVEHIDAWRDGNGRKAMRLYVAGILQGVSVVLVASAAIVVIV